MTRQKATRTAQDALGGDGRGKPPASCVPESRKPQNASCSISVPLENVEAIRFAREVKRYESRWPELLNLTAFPAQGGAGGKSRGARMAAEGLRAGYPDILLDWPAQGFHGLRIELKRQRFSPSDVGPHQRAWHERLRIAGFRVEVCGGFEAAWAVLCDYLGRKA